MKRWKILSTLIVPIAAAAQPSVPPPMSTLNSRYNIRADTLETRGDNTNPILETTSPKSALVFHAQSEMPTYEVNVKNFGSRGDASHGSSSVAIGLGQKVVSLIGTIPVIVGQHVMLAGSTTSRTVSSVSNAGGNTSVTLSTPFSAVIASNSRFDFYTQDDLPAFNAALGNMQKKGIGEGYIPAGGYYLSSFVKSVPNIKWIGQNISFAPTGGIEDSINQSMPFDPIGLYISNRFTSAAQDEGLMVTADNEAENSITGYQKNAIHIQMKQGAQSSYAFRGDETTAVRDLVGYSVQGSCKPGNMKCSLFGSEYLISMTPNTDGPMTGWEDSVHNSSGIDSPESGSWNNKSGATILGFGDAKGALTTGLLIGGNRGFHTGLEFAPAGLLDFAWALRNTGIRNNLGITTDHQDLAYLDRNGRLFGQSLHIVSGQAIGKVNGKVASAAESVIESDPQGGVVLKGDGSAIFGGTVQMAVLAVSQLPSHCEPGQQLYAADGRKAGEKLGDGSGVAVVCTLSRKSGVVVWFSMFSGQKVSN